MGEKKENRNIFIGDIQGCYKEFKLILKKLKIKNKDRVFLVGDLINRGPKSYKVLKLIYKNRDKFFPVLGNHEINFFRYLEGKLCEGENKRTFDKLKKKLNKKPEILNYIKSLPTYIEEENFILVHAGVIPGKNLEDHTIDEITRVREYNGKPWYEYYKGSKKIIYGHRAVDGLRIRENTIGLDSGCVYGKFLTAYILETGEIVIQNALKLHYDPYKNNYKN